MDLLEALDLDLEDHLRDPMPSSCPVRRAMIDTHFVIDNYLNLTCMSRTKR